MQQQSRIHPRVPVHRSAEIREGSATPWRQAVLEDLSATGAEIRVADTLPVQSEIEIRFTLSTEGDEPQRDFHLTAIVVRKVHSTEVMDALPISLGVHFLEMEGAAYDWMRRWVWFRFDS